MYKTLTTGRTGAMPRFFGIAALAAATLAMGLPAQAASAAPPKAAPKKVTCAVRTAAKWSTCLGDNAKVARGQQVFVALNRSSGRRVQFRVKNHKTGKVLATPAARQTPNGRRYLVWTNRTTKAVTIDLEARTDGATSARATLYLR